MTNAQSIIDEFHTIIGDSTELSSEEELALLNKIYKEVLNSRLWSFLLKEATGTVTGTEITQPTDFSSLGNDKTIYLGDNADPITLIPFTERRKYTNSNGYGYYDARQGKFIFLRSQADNYSFDYIYRPSDLTAGSAPVFPVDYWSCLSFFMASDNDFIQLSEKARSYSQENRARGQAILDNMIMWASRLENIDTYGN